MLTTFAPVAYCCAASYQQRITGQLKRLGGSYDWERVAFTMNEVSSNLVNRQTRILSSIALSGSLACRD